MRTTSFVAVTASSLLTMTACDLCANEILADVPSPPGEHRAIVFLRDCGATTGFSGQVSVLRRGEQLGNSSGNAYTSDSRLVSASWESDKVLRLTSDPHARTFTKKNTVAGVEVVYGGAAPPHER